MKSIKQFLINLFSQFGASAINALFLFVFMYFAAKRLGVETFGQFSTVQIYVTSFFVLTDLGTSNAVVRKVAETKEKLNELVGNLLLLKLFLGILVYVCILFGSYNLNYSLETQRLILIYGISLISYSLSDGCNAIFNGHEKLTYSSITIFGRAIGIGVSTILILLNLNLYYIFVAMSFFNGLAFSFSLYFLIKKFVNFSLNFDIILWKSIIEKAWPFGIVFILNTINLSFGPILLSTLYGEIQVGYYNLALKLITPILLIISAYNSAIFPVFSRLKSFASDKISYIFPLSLKISFVIGFSSAAAIFVLAESLIKVLFPGYDASITILRIIIWYMFWVLLSTATFNVLYYEHQEKTLTKIYLLSSVLCIFMCLLLIPKYGVIGLCISQVILSSFQFLLSFIALHKKYQFNYWNLSVTSFLGVMPMFLMGLFLSFRWSLLSMLVFISLSFIFTIYYSPTFDKNDKELLFYRPMNYLRNRIRGSHS